MREQYLQFRPGITKEAQDPQFTTTTDDTIEPRVKKSPTTSEVAENIPAHKSERGPLDLVFASAATLTLWLGIIALAKWLL